MNADRESLFSDHLRWLRFWFRNSYDLWRSHPSRWKSSRLYATQRGLRAALAGHRQRLYR